MTERPPAPAEHPKPAERLEGGSENLVVLNLAYLFRPR